MTVDFAAQIYLPGDNDLALFVVRNPLARGDLIAVGLFASVSWGTPLHDWLHGRWSADRGFVARSWPMDAPSWYRLDGSWMMVGGYWGPEVPEPHVAGAGLQTRLQVATSSGAGVRDLFRDLLEAYVLPGVPEQFRALLRGRMHEAVEGATSAYGSFADGHGPNPGGPVLSLASAQRAASKVARGLGLLPAEVDCCKALLGSAPLTFGYWGPFKSLLKWFDMSLAPEEFGTALGRLSLAACSRSGRRGRAPVSEVDGEDLAWLAGPLKAIARHGVVPGTTQRATAAGSASLRTIRYMERRMRRRLMTLGESNPAVYARVVAQLLITYDDVVGSHSYVPAHVLGGALPVLDDFGRSVRLPLSQDAPRYAHPHAWADERAIALVRTVLDRVTASPEILTFCLQVLRVNHQPAPPLTLVTLPLALESTDREVLRLAHQMLPTTPEIWKSLPGSAWAGFFRHAVPASVIELCAALLAHAPLPYVVQACEGILVGPVTPGDQRLLPLAQVYLAYTRNSYLGSVDSSVAAVEIVARELDLGENREVWQEVLSGLDVPVLLPALLRVMSGDSTSVGSVGVLRDLVMLRCDELARGRWLRGSAAGFPLDGWQAVIHASCLCLDAPDPRATSLGWSLLDLLVAPEVGYRGGPAASAAAAEALLWAWLRDRASRGTEGGRAAPHYIQLVMTLLARSGAPGERLVELLADERWTIVIDSLAEGLLSDPVGARIAWDALGEQGAEVLHGRVSSNATLLKAIGDAVPPDAVLALTGHQRAILLAYVRAEPRRLGQDPAFGVALAALPDVELQEIALRQLVEVGVLGDWWLALAECALPRPLEAARRYVDSLSDRNRFTDCVLAALDSGVAVVRDLGLQFLDRNDPRLDQDRIWAALVHSDDHHVQARVAEEAAVRRWSDDSALAEFDRRVLANRRRNRRAKELVKGRIGRQQSLAPSDVPPTIDERRITALLDMARGSNRRDSEWAIRRLTVLALHGLDIPGIEVSRVTTGGSDGHA